MPFVLLHHTLHEDQHWDLCLDQGQTLATWQLIENPATLTAPNRPAPARRIQDHRRFYLDYEGPVSADRGHVVRVDRGTYTLLDQQPGHWRVRLAGSVLIGTFVLTATDHLRQAWTIYRTGDPN